MAGCKVFRIGGEEKYLHAHVSTGENYYNHLHKQWGVGKRDSGRWQQWPI